MIIAERFFSNGASIWADLNTFMLQIKAIAEQPVEQSPAADGSYWELLLSILASSFSIGSVSIKPASIIIGITIFIVSLSIISFVYPPPKAVAWTMAKPLS